METNTQGENPDADSPSISKPTVLSATAKLRQFILGEYAKKLPRINWNTDGNIFAVIGTLGKAWKNVDRKVYGRIQYLSHFAMAGRFPADAGLTEKFEEECRTEIEGYDELLSFCISLSVADYVEDIDSDDDDEDSDDTGYHAKDE